MVVYGIQYYFDNEIFFYIGSTNNFRRRINEHRYRIKNPFAHLRYTRNKFYTKLREYGIDDIKEEDCFILDEYGGKKEEQDCMDQIPKHLLLNAYRSIK